MSGGRSSTVVLERPAEVSELEPYRLRAGQRVYLAIRRVLEFTAAAIALLILFIPFLIIAAIQKILAPKEPVFFHQERIGQYGRPITITKFRSMRSTAPHYCPTGEFSEGAAYITKFGHFLRHTSIDELPQLFQVVTGKMSLIGPRPLIPQETRVHELRQAAGVYQLRPGITGWAQVNGRDMVGDEEKAKLDMEYLSKVGLQIDVKILCLTVGKVLFGKEIKS